MVVVMMMMVMMMMTQRTARKSAHPPRGVADAQQLRPELAVGEVREERRHAVLDEHLEQLLRVCVCV